MKKSEACVIINNAIWDGAECRDEIDLVFAAERVLDAIIKAGMLPPYIDIEFGSKIIRDSAWDKEDGSF